METDVTYFASCLPHLIRLQPFAGMRLAEIPFDEVPVKQKSTPQKLNAWWRSLPLENVDLFCIHGVQDGALYAMLVPWLAQDPKRQVLFLEEDPQTLLKLMHTELGYQLFSHPQIGLYWLEGGESQRLLLTQLTWDFFRLRWHFIPHLHSTALTEEQIKYGKRLYEQLEGIQIHAHTLAQELLAYGEPYFTNFYANLPWLAVSDCGDRLFKRFKGLPICICGSGPSLQKDIPMLRLIRDRALLIGAGSAVAVLLAHGIIPDFGVAIDPTLSQAERLESQLGVEIPYFYRPRIHPRALQAMKGRRLYVTGAGAYEAPLYIENALKLPQAVVDEGHNVLHFALSIAQCLQGGSSKSAPLILLGADGAYQEKQEYSPGIPASSRAQAEDAPLKTLREDHQGNLLVTRKQWIAERAWLSQFALNHPKTLVINATAGGLPIEGMRHLPLADCIAKYCTRTYDVSGWVWSELQRIALPPFTASKIAELLTEWTSSLARIEEAMQLAEHEIAQGNWHLVAFAEAAWQYESAYNPILSLFERIYTRLQRVEEHQAEALEPVLQHAAKQKLLADRIHFLTQGCALHLKLLSKVHVAKGSPDTPLPTLHGLDRLRAIQSYPRRGLVTQGGYSSFKSHSGLLLAEGDFQEAFHQPLRQGVQRHFYANGLLAWEGAYDQGFPIGVHRTFFPSGILKQAIDYTQGCLLLYDPTGALYAQSKWPPKVDALP